MSDSDSDKDLFGLSDGEDDDTDDLMNASAGKAIAKKKKSSTPAKKKRASIPDADNDSDDDDDGLFDSDDEDDKKPAAAKSKPKKKLKKKGKSTSKKQAQAPVVDTSKLSRKEKLDLLQARKREASDAVQSSSKRGESGYDSGDSYGSENYQRTKEDDDFIDVDGEDEDAVREYYAEQHFDDERPDEEMEVKPKKGKGSSSAKKRTRGPDQLSDDDMDNPIVAAVQRMKKKKKVKKGEQQLMVEAGEFLAKMEQAAIDDEAAIKQKKPGLNKLRMLPEVLAEISKVDMHRAYLESDFLKIAKRWIQPLPDGSLGNITVRQKLLATIAKMSGENGITTHDLKESDFGKLIMTLYMHKKETPALKRQHKNLIEQWSRIIFNKSGNMRNLSSAQAYRRGKETGLTAIARSQAAAAAMASTPESAKKKSNSSDLGAVLANGKRSARDAGKNRVRVPYSKGFQFTVRPQAIVGDVADKKTRITNVKEKRESLHKRMLEKNRPTSKNGRSANVSIEGRPTK